MIERFFDYFGRKHNSFNATNHSFKKLESIGIVVELVENPVFVENLKAIAINCNQLNHFKLFVYGSDSLLKKQIFECLGFSKI